MSKFQASSLERDTYLIHLGPPKGDDVAERIFPGRTIGRIARSLGESGVVLFSRGKGAYEFGGVTALVDDGSGHDPWRIELDTVGVIRDHNGALGIAPVVDKISIPVVNGAKVRQLDNLGTAAESGIYIDQGENRTIETFVIPKTADVTWIQERMGRLPFSLLPARGANKVDELGVGPNDPSLPRVLKSIEGSGREYVLRQVIDTSGPFPAGIRYTDERSERLANARKDSGKIVRMFWFAGSDQSGQDIVDWLPVAHFSPSEETSAQKELISEGYAYIDRDTVPGDLVGFTTKFARTTVRWSGQTEVSGAFDFGYNTESGWYVHKGHFWQPVPPSYKDARAMNNAFVDLTTKQLRRAAGQEK